MADIPSKKFKGVYYRELKNGDRSYFVIMRIDGKQKRISMGRKSEGITEAFCFQQKIKILNTDRYGDEVAEILQKKKKSDPTFLEIAEYYFENGPAKESTKKIMRYLVNQLPFKDSKRVKVNDLIDLQNDLSKRLSENTVNNKITLLNAIFHFAIDAGKYRFENPCLKIKKYKVDDKRMRYLTKNEVALLLDDVRDNPQLYLFVKLALCTGARISTIVNIHADDVSGDTVRLKNIKTNRNYTGYLDSETVELLKDCSNYVLAWPEHDQNKPPTVNSYQWRLLRIFNKLFNDGVDDPKQKVVVHTLRHTAASLLLQNGTPLHVVQKVLDHQSIRSTERYAKLNQDIVKNEIKNLWN